MAQRDNRWCCVGNCHITLFRGASVTALGGECMWSLGVLLPLWRLTQKGRAPYPSLGEGGVREADVKEAQ